VKFHIVTLGCPKNEVDSEGMETLLMETGHSPVDDISEADVVVVNTCGFIDAAVAESVETLRKLSRHRKRGGLLVAAGCLAQREGEKLTRRVPGIDAILGSRSWVEIGRIVELASSRPSRNGGVVTLLDTELQLGAVSRRPRAGSAYVKVADGCDATCTFCIIPSIKGPYKSKPREHILEEVQQLVAGGTREVVLVGQDTTAYGLDRGDRGGLAGLLRSISDVAPELPWLRVLYQYPQRITPSLLAAMADLPQVCKYVDIPLQHSHAEVLRRMKRPHGDVRELVDAIRERVPGVAIRTTFIVGFPGETEEEHRHLLRSMEELRFDRIGVFMYSPQQGTLSASYPKQVPDRVRRRRWREAMETAQRVSLAQNGRMVGRELEVLVEGVQAEAGAESAMTVGRSYRDAPEVDGLVFFNGEAKPGEMVRVRITSALEYDLVGEMIVLTHATAA
jgi:ribosomal protein S12 methylthiotransferase